MNFNPVIIRSARKTISISITLNNEIIVRCPKKISDRTINVFIETKKEWIEKIINFNAAKFSENNSVIDYNEIYVGGKKLPLIFSDKIAITPSGVYIREIKDIKNTFVNYFSDKFKSIVHDLSEQTELKANTVSFKSYKSRWGCCDRNNNLIFNYKLLMLPQPEQNYVIIHELCHTVYFNHSKDFWSLVGKFEPNYKALKSSLKNYDFIIGLY